MLLSAAEWAALRSQSVTSITGRGGRRYAPYAFTEQGVAIEGVGQFILVIRHQRVLLDADLAGLYGVETRVLLQAVQRNLERFPPDFMFERCLRC